MLNDTQNKDIRTLGYVLKRTNYGEADRILNILTPSGKVVAIAKGVRKEKSKLAGGIEMFTLIDFNLHKGKNEFSVVTGAKMMKYYDEIVKDLNKMEIAAMILKMASKLAENLDNTDCFEIVDQSFKSMNLGESLELIESWSLLNFRKAMGEEINLYRDIDGEKLKSEKRYSWDTVEMTFVEDINGEYGENEIKLLRLMVSSDLSVLRRVKLHNNIMAPVLRLARMVV